VLADSFFDVFLAIDGTPSGSLHNMALLRLYAVVDRVPFPVGTDHVSMMGPTAGEPVELLDGDGVTVALLTDLSTGAPAHLEIMPEPGTLSLLAVGALAMLKRRRR
jgi:hypothetical protein